MMEVLTWGDGVVTWGDVGVLTWGDGVVTWGEGDTGLG